MPTEIATELHEHAYGATATILSHKIETKKPVNAIGLTMKFLQNGATLETIAEVLTQFATTIKVKQGGSTVFEMSATDLFPLMQFLEDETIIAHVSDGTGADNHVSSITLIVPFGLDIFPQKLSAEHGLDPTKGDVIVELSVPADGNKVDARSLSIYVFSIVGSRPTKRIHRTARNLTPVATGWDTYSNIKSGSNVILVDLFAFQTTALDAGGTTDVKTIERIKLEINTEEKHLGSIDSELLQIFHGNLSKLATSPIILGTYLYCPFGTSKDKYDGYPLKESARFNINAGDTNVIRMIEGIELPN